MAMGVVVCLPDTLAELQTKKSLRPRMCRTLQLFSFKMGGLQTFPWAELNKKWFQKQHKVQVPIPWERTVLQLNLSVLATVSQLVPICKMATGMGCFGGGR